MCGVLGRLGAPPGDDFESRWAEACRRQHHRGPDSQGEWHGKFKDGEIRLGHQRLAILDLSEAGHQPMTHEQGTLSYNGEVYNYIELREELEKTGEAFISETDTEVVLRAILCWGVVKACERFNGMWAFAWWDARERRLWLARDRFGEKPMYWETHGGALLFASELKSLMAMTGRRYRVNVQVAGEFLLQNQANTSESVFVEGVKRVSPATVMCFKWDRLDKPKTASFWALPDESAERPVDDALQEEVRETFADSVRIRLRSDVPVGVLLSGGLDSSAIAAMVSGEHANSVTLFSGISGDPRTDESRFIFKMAQHLGRDPVTIDLDSQVDNLLGKLEEFTWQADRPLGDFSNVAHGLLMEAARARGITVMLTGQGADELLCGYRKYLGFQLRLLWGAGRRWQALRLLGSFIKNRSVIPQFTWAEAKRYLPGRSARTGWDIAGPALEYFRPLELGVKNGEQLMNRQARDLRRFSLPAILHTEDRMSMAASREIRVPFLDHRLVELLLPLPAETKLRAGWTKFVFRKAMEPCLPADITWRRDKLGFANPQETWLKKPLRRSLEEDYFASGSRIFEHGLVRENPLRARCREFYGQRRGRGKVWWRDIFAPLALEVWLRQFGEHLESPSSN